MSSRSEMITSVRAVRALFARMAGAALVLNFGCAGALAIDPDTDGAQPRGLLEAFEELDREFLGSDVSSAREQVEVLAGALKPCRRLQDEAIELCVLRVAFQDLGFAPAPDRGPAVESSVTHVLAQRRGTCAGLVGAILALGDWVGKPFDAVVFRDHAVLVSRTDPGRYYETLERGRVARAADLARYRKSAAEEVRVGPDGYLAYYVDNLAARLVAEGDLAAAESAFERAITLAPHAARIRYNYGSLLLRQERYRASLSQLRKAIDLGWRHPDAFTNVGVALWHLGNAEAARDAFGTALTLDPSHRQAAANLREMDAGTMRERE